MESTATIPRSMVSRMVLSSVSRSLLAASSCRNAWSRCFIRRCCSRALEPARRMETAIANIMSGKSTTDEMSDAVGFGKWETTGGSAMTKGPTKLRIRLVLESTPEADNQMMGKTASVMRPGTALKAPFRVKNRATRSRMGIARPALGANRSHGTSRQPRNRSA